MVNEQMYFSTSDTWPDPGMLKPHLDLEATFRTQEIGLSLDQPLPAERTSPEVTNFHIIIIICSNNELAILDYLPSANVAVKGGKKKKKDNHIYSPPKCLK